MDAIIAWISNTLIQMVKIAVTAPISSFISTAPFLSSVTVLPTTQWKYSMVALLLSSGKTTHTLSQSHYKSKIRGL
jgi:hypothetical protein